MSRMTRMRNQKVLGTFWLPIKDLMRAVLADPLPQLTLRLPVADMDEREGPAELLPQAAPVEVDHLGPGSRVQVLFAVGIDLVHRPVRMPEEYGLHAGRAVQHLPRLALQILEDLGLLLEALDDVADSPAPAGVGRVVDPGLEEIKERERDEPDREPRIEHEAKEHEDLHAPDLVEILALPLHAVDDLQHVDAAVGHL